MRFVPALVLSLLLCPEAGRDLAILISGTKLI
jgi:hypothetical protein